MRQLCGVVQEASQATYQAPAKRGAGGRSVSPPDHECALTPLLAQCKPALGSPCNTKRLTEYISLMGVQILSYRRSDSLFVSSFLYPFNVTVFTMGGQVLWPTETDKAGLRTVV